MFILYMLLSSWIQVNTTCRHERDVRDAYLVTSTDGAHWDLSNIYQNKPLIERGGSGAWEAALPLQDKLLN